MRGSMAISFLTKNRRTFWAAVALCVLALGLLSVPDILNAEERTKAALPPRIQAFHPGESLTYDISWSKIVTAGTAVMEVKEEMAPDRKELLRFVVTSRTVGMMGKLYPLGDTIWSLFDPQIMQSLSFSLTANRGKRTRRSGLVFDHERKTAVSTTNDDPPETIAIPDQVQDTLSALYYLRTREDLDSGKPITFEVCDHGKTWPVSVQTVGREKVQTRAGEFATLKVSAHKGLFMSEGEIFIWFTDDSRRIPVLIKSTVSIGSLVFSLTEMKTAETVHAATR
jgi:hypothetical protein